MKNKIILSLLILLVFVPAASAVLVLYDDFPVNGTFNSSNWVESVQCSLQACNVTNNEGLLFNFNNPPGGVRFVSTSIRNFGDLNAIAMELEVTNLSDQAANPRSLFLQDGAGGQLQVDHTTAGAASDFNEGDIIRAEILENGTATIYVNGTAIVTGNGFVRTGGLIFPRVWNSQRRFHFDNVFFDELPFQFFTDFNMTSDGGCTVWNTNTSNPCNTTDRTPTVKFLTGVNASCRIGVDPVSTPAFVNLTSLRDCSTTGGMNHTCTLISEDQLFTGLSDLKIGCNSSIGFNETDPLAINLFGLDFTNLNQTNDLIYTPNWSQIDFSSFINLSGNWSWNGTFLNISPFNVSPTLFIATNNATSTNATLLFSINSTDPWWDWRCFDKIIGLNETDILNITANTTVTFDCFLDLKNISTTYVNWIVTENRASWVFNYSFFFEEI